MKNQNMTQSMLRPFLSIAGAFVIIGATGAFAFTASARPAHAQDPQLQRTITVMGDGSASGTPDVAYLSLGVSATDADPAKALNGANEAIDKVTKSLIALGIAETNFQTSAVNLYARELPVTGMVEPSMGVITVPSVAPSTGEANSGTTVQAPGLPTINAQLPAKVYVAEITLNIKVRDLSKIGSVISVAVENGANNVYGLSFGLDDSSKVESEARTAAVKNARSRADELAAALGVKVGSVVQIEEIYNGGNDPRPLAYSNMVGGGTTVGAVPVSQGQLSFNIQVRVVFSIVE